MIDMADLENGQELVYGKAMTKLAGTADRQYQKGYEKYKVHLTTFNGRDSANDAFEEAVDLIQYVQQLAMERDAIAYWLYVKLTEDGGWNYIPKAIADAVEAIGERIEAEGGYQAHA